ncbi:MAG: hypothetical protein IJ683_05890 [Butyrivibrio sp.]|nr:hypothetical protein [Butyrivibrio sp.]MBR1641838.1 hypothetical protein [Butyrivibrio sp.]
MNKKKAIIAIVLIFIVGISFFLFHPHTYAIVEQITPTCTESGSATHKCWCGKSYTETVPAIGHNYEKEITKEATCTENGLATFTCSNCGDSYTEDIISTEHNYIKKTADIDIDNCLKYVCANCQDSYVEEHEFSYSDYDTVTHYKCEKCWFIMYSFNRIGTGELYAVKDSTKLYSRPYADDAYIITNLNQNDCFNWVGSCNGYGDDYKTIYFVVENDDYEYAFLNADDVSVEKIATSSSNKGTISQSSNQQQPAKAEESNQGQPQQQESNNTGSGVPGLSFLGQAGDGNCGETGINWDF